MAIFQGSGVILDPETARVVAEFDKATHTLETDDPKILKLCKLNGFKEIKKVPPKPKEVDPLYDPPAGQLPTKKPTKNEVKK